MIRLERPIRIEDPRARGWASPYIETICADRSAVWFGRWCMTAADALTLAAAIEEAVAAEWQEKKKNARESNG